MKKLFVLMMTLLAIGVPVMAVQDMPLFTEATFHATYPAGIACTFMNERTGETHTVTSTLVVPGQGWCGYQWGNSVSGYQDGDIFKVSIAGVPDKEMLYDRSIPVFIIDEIVPSSAPPSVQPGCPECVIPPGPDCPPIQPMSAETAAAFLAAGAIITGVGVRIFKSTSSTGVVTAKKTHSHFGATTYHNIDTVHSNAAIRHKKGEVHPKYVDGKYVVS